MLENENSDSKKNLVRVNLHLTKDYLTKLDELSVAINKKINSPIYKNPISRADLIRFAVSRVFSLEFPSVHIAKEELWDIIRFTKDNLIE